MNGEWTNQRSQNPLASVQAVDQFLFAPLKINCELRELCSGQQDVVHVTRLFFTAKSAKDAKLLNFLVFLASWWLSNIILTITESRESTRIQGPILEIQNPLNPLTASYSLCRGLVICFGLSSSFGTIPGNQSLVG